MEKQMNKGLELSIKITEEKPKKFSVTIEDLVKVVEQMVHEAPNETLDKLVENCEKLYLMTLALFVSSMLERDNTNQKEKRLINR